jgi:hypothetical protein
MPPFNPTRSIRLLLPPNLSSHLVEQRRQRHVLGDRRAHRCPAGAHPEREHAQGVERRVEQREDEGPAQGRERVAQPAKDAIGDEPERGGGRAERPNAEVRDGGGVHLGAGADAHGPDDGGGAEGVDDALCVWGGREGVRGGWWVCWSVGGWTRGGGRGP